MQNASANAGPIHMSPAHTSLIELVFPQHINHHGTLFGGQGLAFMDKAAFIAGSRFSRRSLVTASSEKIDFHLPASPRPAHRTYRHAC